MVLGRTCHDSLFVLMMHEVARKSKKFGLAAEFFLALLALSRVYVWFYHGRELVNTRVESGGDVLLCTHCAKDVLGSTPRKPSPYQCALISACGV